jgi:VCBS repeat-containing protein
LTDTFTVYAEDGAAKVVTVTINGTNDAAIVSSASEELTETNAPLSTSGTLTSDDVDNPDNVFTPGSTTGAIGDFSIDAAGNWIFTANSAFDSLNVGGSVSETYNVTSVDGTPSTVKITINGTNDAAIVSSASKELTETNASLSTSGTLTSDDVDNPDNVFTPGSTTGLIGDFSIDASGNWTFTANSAFDSLNVGDSVSETYNVTSVDGTASTVEITVNGTNDAAIVSSAVVALAETNAPLSTSGTLTSDDVDNPDNAFTASSTTGSIGSFSIDASGHWTFTANSAFDSLNVGGSVSETYHVTSIDGTPSTVQITINGTADGPVSAPPVYNGDDDPNNNDSAGPGAVAGGPVVINDGSGGTTLRGSNSGDTINGNSGQDAIYGYGGNDVLNGGDQNDGIYGGAGADTITGGNQSDNIWGGSGNDNINGNDQQDVIYGGSGNDVIDGSAGNDLLIGGFGADSLTGGEGTDTFAFLDSRDTGDTITDYSVAADTLSLTGIDADAAAVGNQDFASVTNTETLASKSVIWFYNSTLNQTIVQADTDGNAATAEFQIQLNGNIGLTGADFLL